MKMLHTVLPLLAGVFLFAADSVPPDAAGLLYNQGAKLAEEGRFGAARLTLQTLVNTYPKSAQAAGARNAIEATLLFEDGQQRLLAGKYGTARLAFQTLISVYPESPLVKQAAERMRTSEKLEQAQSSAPIVRSLRFENTEGVEVQDILQRFEEREIELGVEKPYDARMLEEAKAALTELLRERGVANARVKVDTRAMAPRSIEITFRASKD